MVNKITSSIPSCLVKRWFFIVSSYKYWYSLQCTPYQKRSEISSEDKMSLRNKSYLRGSLKKKTTSIIQSPWKIWPSNSRRWREKNISPAHLPWAKRQLSMTTTWHKGLTCGHGRILEVKMVKSWGSQSTFWKKHALGYVEFSEILREVRLKNRNTLQMQSLKCVQMHESIMTYQSNKHPEMNQNIQTCTESKSDCHPESFQTDQTLGSRCEAICSIPPACLLFKRTSTWQRSQSHQGRQCWDPSIFIWYIYICPPGNYDISYQGTFEDDFPFPQVGYASSWRVYMSI